MNDPASLAHASARRPRAWVMTMTWEDLLFMHWEVPTELIRARLPAGLELDTFEGRAYVGVVPFRMTRVRARFLPPLPGASAFPELNVRTYVVRGGRPGVWFFSLDAGSPLAVRAARTCFLLPYFDAAMSARAIGEGCAYESRRTHRGAPPASLRIRYAPIGPARVASLDTLDRWLTDRLTLYAADSRGRIFRSDVSHGPWPLQPARAEINDNHMTDALGLPLVGAPLLHFARRLEVRAWWPMRA